MKNIIYGHLKVQVLALHFREASRGFAVFAGSALGSGRGRSHSLTDVLDQLDKSWVLNTYCKMIQIASEKVEPTNLQNARNLLRRACVFNLPCMLFMFSKNSDRLVQFIDQFCTDPDEEVRMCIASSLHEIFALHVEKSVLLSSFFELLRSGSIDVVAKVAFNLDKMLKDLYKTVNEKPGKHSAVQLDRLILGSNNILHNTGSWRSHEALLKSLATLPQCISQRQIVETFIPLLKKETLSVRAIPCRVAAADSLLVLMRHVAADSPRRQVIEFFNEQIAKNKCSYRRIIFIDVVEIVLKKFSKRFFLENFLEQTLVLTTDIISNIRIRALRVLPKIKSRLRFADDNEVLLRIERAVRDLLRLDCNKSTRQILNSAAVELSRCETCERVDKEDEEKKAEEDRLWKTKKGAFEQDKRSFLGKKSEEEEDREIRPTGIRRPDASRASSWRSERRAVAVVRPQLVVMMRSASPSPLTYRSPSPAPKESSSRPSRLPLSTTTREREKLRKTAAESVFSDSRNHRSSSVTSSRGSIMSTSASSAESSANNDSTGGYGLRRSATSTSVFGASSYTSNASYALSHSRSTSNMRRPTYGLTHVSTQSTFERKPSHVSLRIRNVSSVLK
ncbi:unnamed protein product [Caenorhabditis auriculariae]|uniref:Uncharacterized protein n=1 Tax=Caenorhabditis auriculariae TaxID=2777116 RepID=A0A8S1HUK4_9PELO|nr:unnamed protein product [Caenorhabditis auriculariae]